jgi:hypothetical protein
VGVTTLSGTSHHQLSIENEGTRKAARVGVRDNLIWRQTRAARLQATRGPATSLTERSHTAAIPCTRISAASGPHRSMAQDDSSGAQPQQHHLDPRTILVSVQAARGSNVLQQHSSVQPWSSHACAPTLRLPSRRRHFPACWRRRRCPSAACWCVQAFVCLDGCVCVCVFRGGGQCEAAAYAAMLLESADSRLRCEAPGAGGARADAVCVFAHVFAGGV